MTEIRKPKSSNIDDDIKKPQLSNDNGIKFDDVQPQWAGVSPIVDGDSFYEHQDNKLYPWKILKLHGSLNWFRFSSHGLTKLPFIKLDNKEEFEKKQGKIALMRAVQWWPPHPYEKWWGIRPQHNNWLLEPIIITPILYKDYYYQEHFITIKKTIKELR